MWNRLPIWFRAVVTGLLVSGIPTTIWAVIATVNLRLTPAIPWSVPVMAVVLWYFWRYLKRFDADRLRAKRLSPRTTELALLAGGSAVAAIWALFQALRGVLHIAQPPNDLGHVPLWTVASAIVMLGLVAGIAEETGFRGFMQLPLERAYGPVAGLGVTAVIFTLIHLSHGAAILPFLPFYFVVALVYGLLAYLTGSIVPGIILHATGDVMLFAMRFAAARQGAVPPSGGISNGAMMAFCAFTIVSVVLFRLLARDTRVITPTAAAVA